MTQCNISLHQHNPFALYRAFALIYTHQVDVYVNDKAKSLALFAQPTPAATPYVPVYRITHAKPHQRAGCISAAHAANTRTQETQRDGKA